MEYVKYQLMRTKIELAAMWVKLSFWVSQHGFYERVLPYQLQGLFFGSASYLFLYRLFEFLEIFVGIPYKSLK